MWSCSCSDRVCSIPPRPPDSADQAIWLMEPRSLRTVSCWLQLHDPTLSLNHCYVKDLHQKPFIQTTSFLQWFLRLYSQVLKCLRPNSHICFSTFSSSERNKYSINKHKCNNFICLQKISCNDTYLSLMVDSLIVEQFYQLM